MAKKEIRNMKIVKQVMESRYTQKKKPEDGNEEK